MKEIIRAMPIMNIPHGTDIIATVITIGITIADSKEITGPISRADVLIMNATSARTMAVEIMVMGAAAVMTTTDATK